MSNVWRQIRNGAGGYVTGIDISGTTIVCRTDTSGAYRWDAGASKWVHLITPTSMPVFRTDAEDCGSGVVEIRVAPSEPTRLYMMYMGDVYRSSSAGNLWIPTGRNYAAATDTAANIGNSTRYMGQRMAVDPNNPDVVYMGTYTDGVYRSFNAGVTWAQVSTSDIPVATANVGGTVPGHPGMCFDPTSGTTLVSGVLRTNKIYMPSYGNGVYYSADAGVTWAALSGAPTLVRKGKVAANGDYYAVNVSGSANNIYKWNGSSFSALTCSNAEGILLDPSDATRVIGITSASGLFLSTNSGSSFGSVLPKTRAYTNIPWHAFTNENSMSHGDAVFSGTTIWLGYGIGVSTAPFVDSPSSVEWTPKKGIENLTCNHVLCPPIPNSKKVYTAGWDRAVFGFTDPETYPSVHSPFYRFTLGGGGDVDAAADTITLSAHGMLSNQTLMTTAADGSTLPAGLTHQNTYYAIIIDANTIKVSATSGPGAAVNLTDTGSGTGYFALDSITMAWHMDYAKSDPTFVAYMSAWGTNLPPHPFGYKSSDSGDTWRPFPTGPLGFVGSKNGGGIAAASSTSMVATPSNNSVPHYTTDGGATWSACPIPGTGNPYRHFTSADVDTGADTITVTAHGFSGNEQVRLAVPSSHVLPGGLTHFAQIYYVIVTDANTIQLSTSAGPGAAVNITGTGTGGEYWIMYGSGSHLRSFAAAAVNTTDDTITINNHGYRDNASVVMGTGGTLPSPLVELVSVTYGNRVTYYVIVVDANTIKLSASAGPGAAVNLTTAGSGTNYLVSSPDMGWGGAHYNQAVPVVADPNTAGTFFAYNDATQRCYRSTDGGATWAERGPSSGLIDNQAIHSFKLIAVPGQSGHLFLASGSGGGANPLNAKLSRSEDGGVTWANSNANVKEPQSACIGATAPGASYPTVYFVGYYSNVPGVWRSTDNCVSFTQIGSAGGIDLEAHFGSSMSASPDVYGDIYMCLPPGKGYVYRTEAMQYGRLR